MDIFTYICTLVLSLISLFVGLSTSAFGLLDDPLQIQFGSFATSLLVIIFGDRIAAGLRDRKLKKYIDEKMTLIPTVNIIKRFSNGIDAISYISSRLCEAKQVLNTRISNEESGYNNEAYNKALKSALRRDLVFKDVVSPGFVQLREDFVQFTKGRKGEYKDEVIEGSTPSFLNFTVLDFGVDEELIVGWALSRYRGPEQDAYLIRDKRVISYFKEYHHALFEGSRVQ